MRPSEHLYDFGRPVAYYPGLVKHLGSVNSVLLFCQFFYWHDKTDSELGVYKSVEEIERETGLSYREQVTARKMLVKRGVLIETHKRLEHRIYYRIDRDRLDALLSSANCETSNSRNALSAVRGKPKAQFDHTEITTETTAENYYGASAPCADPAQQVVADLHNAIGAATPSRAQLVPTETAADQPAVPKHDQLVDPAFEAAWKAYPKREGANPKNKALSAWKARLREGETAEAMMQGVLRYAAYCQVKGSTGTEYVMQAQRFFGKGREYQNEWKVTGRAGKPSITQNFKDKDYRGTPDDQFADFLQ